MADVITRFKLETTQFDSKLRDAAKGLQEVTRVAQTGGKDFVNFSQKAVESARALGQTASGATNAKDKVRDLVGAFNDAAKAYNNLTQAQQQSDFGKELSNSLIQLQQRIKEAKEELYGLGDAVEQVKGKGGGGSIFGEGGFTGMLAVTGGNLLASGLTKLGSELADTIQQSIELARQGEGVRLAFERLNKPGLLDNLKESTHGTVSELELMKAAIKFDNFKLPLEDLGTYLAFAQQKAQDTGESVDNMVTSIVNGLGRQSVQILDNLGISAAEIRNRMKEGGDMTQVVAQIIREEMTKAGEYVETAATRAARAAADAANEMEDLGKKAGPVAEEWSKTWNSIKMGCIEILNWGLTPIVDSIKDIRELLSEEYTLKIKADVPNLAEGSNIDENGNYIKKPSDGNWAGFDAANGRYYNQIDSMPEITVTGNKPKKTTRPRGGGSTTDPTAKIQGAWDKAFTKSLQGADKLKPADFIEEPSVWAEYADGIRGTFESIKDGMSNLTEWTPDFDPYAQNIQKMTDALKQEQAALNLAGQAASLFGTALSTIEDPAAKVGGIIAQAVASIALAYAQALATDPTMKTSVYTLIAGAAAAMTSMFTTIASIHSSTGYANGGMIKGNSYSGDNVGGLVDGSQLVGLNAGEVVLSASQQSNLASIIKSNNGGGGYTPSHVSGEQIWIALSAYTKRTGKGEIVTWR